MASVHSSNIKFASDRLANDEMSIIVRRRIAQCMDAVDSWWSLNYKRLKRNEFHETTETLQELVKSHRPIGLVGEMIYKARSDVEYMGMVSTAWLVEGYVSHSGHSLSRLQWIVVDVGKYRYYCSHYF